jgi:hypothetical protein
MTIRAALLADGPSDLPLAGLVDRLAVRRGAELQTTPIDPRGLTRFGTTVAERLTFAANELGPFDLFLVHRDSESADPESRYQEIASATEIQVPPFVVVPIVPQRMTEAWLLLDERAIREVAGRPTGRASLNLPTLQEAERMADPKTRLREALLAAGEPSGRNRQRFARDFGRHRSLLLQRLNPQGRVAELQAWRRMERDLMGALEALSKR